MRAESAGGQLVEKEGGEGRRKKVKKEGVTKQEQSDLLAELEN